MVKSYYGVLGVARNATEEEIRRRFRKLAMEKHPDRFVGAAKRDAEREFQDLTEAFNVLTDAERRRTHDLELHRAGGPGRPGAAPGDDKSQLLKTYLTRGVQAYKEGNYGSAAESFEAATRTDAESSQAWYNLALTFSRQERLLARAASAIERACELEPMKPAYLKLAGRLFARAGQPARARRYLEEALSWGGPDAEVEKFLGELRAEPKARRGLFGKGA
jgi:tetratricopeptide (TPR) repeat protein